MDSGAWLRPELALVTVEVGQGWRESGRDQLRGRGGMEETGKERRGEQSGVGLRGSWLQGEGRGLQHLCRSKNNGWVRECQNFDRDLRSDGELRVDGGI